MVPNWANQTIWTGDNLPILRGMNSESVDLIYLDPPFNSKANYAAPIGSKAAGAAFKDTWTLSDVDAEWINLIEAKHPVLYRVLLAAMTSSDKSYLAYMAARLLELHRVLKPTGSVYLHCDPTMSHYLKLVMDAIFGRRMFLNEILWCYNVGGKSKKHWARKHDTLLFYVKSAEWVFNGEAVGVPRDTGKKSFGGKIGTDDQGRRYQDKRVKATGKYYRYYLDAPKIPEDWWIGINSIQSQSSERVGYPTQKPLVLLDRIIKASSNAGDVVLDPFAGCATACVSAESLRRQWVGIDISSKAAELVRQRMRDQLGMFYQGAHRTDVPSRTDIGKLPRYNSPENRKRLYGEQGGNCAGCSTHFEPRHFHVDHIIAWAKGGTDHIENLQLLCGSCNSIKGDRGMDYLKARLQIVS